MNTAAPTTIHRDGARLVVTFPTGKVVRIGGNRAALPFAIVNPGTGHVLGMRSDAAAAASLAGQVAGRIVIEVTR